LRDHLVHTVKAIFLHNGKGRQATNVESGAADSFRPSQTDYIWALKDISFEVKPGEIIGFVGRNGAGKSTLLKILSRITEPTDGKAKVYGRIGSLLEVGTGFHPELTGRENIYLNGAILGMRKAEIDRRFDEIVDFADIEKFIDTPVKRYSSGMYVRIAFAVAAHLESEILIVDEVLAVGDAAFQRRCLGKMNAVANEGKTILFVSHNIDAIQRLTQRSLWLERGRIMRDGVTAEIVQDYLKYVLPTSSGVWDRENTSRQSSALTRDVEFIRLGFENRDGGRFVTGSDLPLSITIRSKISLDRVRFGLTILRVDGIPVGSSFVPARSRIEANDTVVFQLRLEDLRLAPGRFYLNIAVEGAQCGSDYARFDMLTEVLPFEILPCLAAEKVPVWQSSWGSICFNQCTAERIG
jgi:lipopolysaccharide transport system ATP-binding protein